MHYDIWFDYGTSKTSPCIDPPDIKIKINAPCCFQTAANVPLSIIGHCRGWTVSRLRNILRYFRLFPPSWRHPIGSMISKGLLVCPNENSAKEWKYVRNFLKMNYKVSAHRHKISHYIYRASHHKLNKHHFCLMILTKKLQHQEGAV